MYTNHLDKKTKCYTFLFIHLSETRFKFHKDSLVNLDSGVQNTMFVLLLLWVDMAIIGSLMKLVSIYEINAL